MRRMWFLRVDDVQYTPAAACWIGVSLRGFGSGCGGRGDVRCRTTPGLRPFLPQGPVRLKLLQRPTHQVENAMRGRESPTAAKAYRYRGRPASTAGADAGPQGVPGLAKAEE